MHYMLMFLQPPADLERKRDDPASSDYWESWRAYMGAIYASGVVKSGNELDAGFTGTTVRIRDGQRHVHDGPFAETKEMLAGYLIIDVPDLDAALEWAARSPSSRTGATEVRPIRDARQ